MRYDMEQLLQQALSPEPEPDFWLNQQILQKAPLGMYDQAGKGCNRR